MGFKDQFMQGLPQQQAAPQQAQPWQGQQQAAPQQAQPWQGQQQAAPQQAQPWQGQQQAAPQQAQPQPAANPFASYMGVEAAGPRENQPLPGIYRLRLKKHDEWHSPNPKAKVAEWFKAVFDIEQAAPNSGSAVGDEVCFLQAKNVTGIPLIRGFWEAMSGLAGPAFDQAVEAGQVSPASLYGRLIDARVTQGGPTPDGQGYYRVWQFEAVS